MTATPIPRTVALTLYGDLDMSRIRSMPKGRKPVKTWLVPPHKRHNAYSWIEDEIVKNQSQCLIICPFIEPSESQATVKSATKEYDRLRKEIFPGLKLALLHGKMKPEEKNTVMEKMRAGEYQILVATPVVEVGIDLPRATVILIEDADKFGLAALHQLRGRVGRGDKQSYCLLFSSEVPERLRSLEKIQSGLELAELDLKLRGPGDVFGYSQHGFPFLKVADYSDLDTLKKAKSWAEKIKPDLNLYPALREVVESTKIPSVGLN